jgi:hypothetical protein
MYIGRTPNGEVRYAFIDKKSGLNYTTPELVLSKKDNKLHCTWIREYNPNTKQSVMLKYNERKFYRAAAFFIKAIPLLKEEEQDILEQ